MRRCQANLPNRCRRQIDRIARRAFDGEQWMDREGRAATTGNTYCGNLLWQSGLTLLAPLNSIRQSILVYDLATRRLASMQVPSEQSNNQTILLVVYPGI